MTATAGPAAPARHAEVAANARWTSSIGVALLLLLAAEGYTILDIRGLITAHVFLGVLLIAPVLLKTATTGYKFTRYYTGHPAYVRHGPPPMLLRLLGPVVIVSSLAVLGTGVGLLATGPAGGLMLFAHKATFVIWFGAMAIHVLGHVRQAGRDTWAEVRSRSPRGRARLAALALALVAGVGAGAATLPLAAPWQHLSRHESSQGH